MGIWIMTSKILDYLLSPLPFCIGLIISGLLLSGMGAIRLGYFLRISGGAVLLICSLPVFESSLRAGLENQYPPVNISDTPQSDMIVVLGGGIAMPFPPRLEVELNDRSDRILHAFRLYRAGKAKVIFISAGSIVKETGLQSPAYYTSSLLQEWGTPADVMILGEQSRTTRENGLETLAFLESKNAKDATVLLVTSSIHMPRAMATFRKLGINVIASTTDVSAGLSIFPGLFHFLPSIHALNGVSSVWHEYLGIWFYKIREWI